MWFQNGSMNITLKQVPDPVYRVLKREAKRHGRSLNAQINLVLAEDVAETKRRERLSKLRPELERFTASLPLQEDSAPLIRRDRER